MLNDRTNACMMPAGGSGGAAGVCIMNCLHSGLEHSVERGQGGQPSHLQGSTFAASVRAQEALEREGKKPLTGPYSATLACSALLGALVPGSASFNSSCHMGEI